MYLKYLVIYMWAQPAAIFIVHVWTYQLVNQAPTMPAALPTQLAYEPNGGGLPKGRRVCIDNPVTSFERTQCHPPYISLSIFKGWVFDAIMGTNGLLVSTCRNLLSGCSVRAQAEVQEAKSPWANPEYTSILNDSKKGQIVHKMASALSYLVKASEL